MIVSTKGRYAARDDRPSEHQSEKYVPLKEIAARQEISENIWKTSLGAGAGDGFLEGLRGKGRRPPAHRQPGSGTTVGEILMLTEGSLAPVSCLTPMRPLLPRGKLPAPTRCGRG